MKFVRAFVVLSVLASCLTNCVVYRTREMPADAKTFSEFKDKRRWTIQSETDSSRFIRIDKFLWDRMAVSVGDFSPPDHPKGNKKRYWRSGGTNSMRVAHIHVGEGVQINRTLELSYSDIKSVSVHSVSGVTPLLTAASITLWIMFFAVLGAN